MELESRFELTRPSRRATHDHVSGGRAQRSSSPTDSAGEQATLKTAAASADTVSTPVSCLDALWQEFLDRRLNVHGAGAAARRIHVIAHGDARPDARAGTLSRIEIAVLVRVLCGEQQKVVAAELGIACSTASKWYSQALAKLGLAGAPVPLPLVIAARAWASGKDLPVDARQTVFAHGGREFMLLSVPSSKIDGTSSLTLAEQGVAHLLVQGHSREQIAAARSTAMQTVACQLRGIYGKFRLSGRYGLINRGIDLDWFR
jgi:DNA-binding NarL/FixJ family response regulator